MRRKLLTCIALAAAVAVFFGCGDSSSAKTSAATQGNGSPAVADAANPHAAAPARKADAGAPSSDRSGCLMDRLAEEDVFMIVNGQKFTKHDFLVASSLEDKIRRLMSGDPLTGFNPKAEEAVRNSRKRTVSEMQRRALVRQFAQKTGVSVSAKEYDEYTAKLLKAMRQRKGDIISLAKRFGPEESRLFLRYVDDDALAQPLRNHFDKDGILKITDADIMTVSNRWLRAVERTNASNEVELVSMRAALAEARGGVPFDKVAARYSERPDQGVAWCELMLEEMDDNPDLREWAKAAKEGEISDILSLDDGWAIVKVLRRGPEDLPPGSTAFPREVWTFARITRKAFDTAKKLPREEIIQGLLDFRNKKLQKQIGEAIMSDAKIEWPRGENLFD